MDHEQRKAYFLNEIEEITGPQANIAAIVSLLTKLEPGLKQVLDEFLVDYPEGYFSSRDSEEILAFAASRIQRKFYPNTSLALEDQLSSR